MTRYLSLAEIALRTGIKFGTVRSLNARHQLPKADVQVGDRLGWLPDRIDKWHQRRKALKR